MSMPIFVKLLSKISLNKIPAENISGTLFIYIDVHRCGVYSLSVYIQTITASTRIYHHDIDITEEWMI